MFQMNLIKILSMYIYKKSEYSGHLNPDPVQFTGKVLLNSV